MRRIKDAISSALGFTVSGFEFSGFEFCRVCRRREDGSRSTRSTRLLILQFIALKVFQKLEAYSPPLDLLALFPTASAGPACTSESSQGQTRMSSSYLSHRTTTHSQGDTSSATVLLTTEP